MRKVNVNLIKNWVWKKMKCDTEQAGITLEHEKLSLIREVRLSLEAGQGQGGDSFLSGNCFSSIFNPVGSLELVPRFNERDPETFFFCFERVTDARRTIMLQCVLTGRRRRHMQLFL